jgi:hypothetical protein
MFALVRKDTVRLFAVLALATVASGALRADGLSPRNDLDRLPEWQVRRYHVIKPRAEEVRWRQIPWLTDLNEGVRLTQKERRPLLLWVSGDDPLERC